MSLALKDAAERILWTYLEAFIGLLIAANALNITAVKAAAIAAIPAALATIKTLIATRLGDRSASTVNVLDVGGDA